MAEYIEKKQLLNDTRIRKDDNGLVRTHKFLFRNYIKSLPTADMIEREKIDKAIEKIKSEAYSEHIDGADCDDILIVELRDVLEILKNI